MVKNIIFLLFIVFMSGCGLFPETYSAAPISGHVIDADTEQPIEGVHVIVYWKLYKGGYAGRYPTDILKVEETITNKEGRYHFNGWGPITAYAGDLGYQAPELLFFKSGYFYARAYNSHSKMYIGSKGAGEIHVPVADKTETGLMYLSQWNNKNIFLKKYENNNYIENIKLLGSYIEESIRNSPCKVKNINNSIITYMKMVEEVKSQSPETTRNRYFYFPPKFDSNKCK